jgi:hypothetical protein
MRTPGKVVLLLAGVTIMVFIVSHSMLRISTTKEVFSQKIIDTNVSSNKNDIKVENVKISEKKNEKKNVAAETHVQKLVDKPDIKLSVKQEIKGDVKPEVKTNIKSEVKPEVKQEIKQELSPVANPPLVHPIPSQKVLETMSHADLQAFYHSYINSPQETCSSVLRMGKVTDGGWEQCDDPRFVPDRSNCLVYSYGINFDFSYDDDMARYGCEVHAFDPSMRTQSHLRGTKVHFHNTGVAGSDKVLTNAGSNRNENWNLYTIGTQRKLLNHSPLQRRVDIVKMDVEGYELESLMAALDDGSLDDVQQLNFETHVSWSNADPSRDEYLKFLALLRKVYDKGFRMYLTHRNYVWSRFMSHLFHGKERVKCHEIMTVNINKVNPDWKEKVKQDIIKFHPEVDLNSMEWQQRPQQKKLSLDKAQTIV